MNLSPRQREILIFIADQLKVHGYAPTYRDIGDALGIRSTNGVSDHIKALVRKGALEQKSRRKARALVLTPDGWQALSQPVPVAVPDLARLCVALESVLIDLLLQAGADDPGAFLPLVAAAYAEAGEGGHAVEASHLLEAVRAGEAA